jgi:hypothetical protein
MFPDSQHLESRRRIETPGWELEWVTSKSIIRIDLHNFYIFWNNI